MGGLIALASIVALFVITLFSTYKCIRNNSSGTALALPKLGVKLQMNKIEAAFLDRDEGSWDKVPKLDLGERSSIESQQRVVGISKDDEKYLLLYVHACDQCVCFESIKVLEDTVIVGFGECIYFVEVLNATFKVKKMDGYFGDLYTPDEFGLPKDVFHILAASASHLYHFRKNSEELWRSPELGIDGVIVNDVISNTIRISGEWDPPGGWEEAEINLVDGTNAI